jgi:hypothetical protein
MKSTSLLVSASLSRCTFTITGVPSLRSSAIRPASEYDCGVTVSMLATSLPRLEGLGAFARGADALDSELAGVLSAEGMRKFLRLLVKPDMTSPLLNPDYSRLNPITNAFQ